MCYSSEYFTEDANHRYSITICQQNSEEDRAVKQYGYLWPDTTPWKGVGKYKGAQLTGGSKSQCQFVR